MSASVRICLLAITCLAAMWPLSAAATEVDVAIIVHPDVALDSLGKAQLLDYYTGDIQRWPDGVQVVVTDLKSKGPVRDGFYGFLGRRPSRMKSIWLRRMLSGEGEPPEAFETEEDVVRRVAATPGAVGFVHSRHVTPDVRVVLRIRAQAEAGNDSGP